MSKQEPEYRTQADLLYTLENGSPDEQDIALARLADVGDAEALDAVIDYLHSRLPDVSPMGLRVLRVLAHKYIPADRYALSEILIPFLGTGDWSQRLIAVRLLGTHPNELAIEPLRELIAEARDEIEDLRRQPSRPFAGPTLNTLLGEAVLALAHCGHMSIWPDVAEFIEDPLLRPVAVQALGIIGTETERDQLEEFAEDDETRVRDAAQWALGAMDGRLEQLMAGPDKWPEPPPDRLHPLYWMHRLLFVSEDSLLQFLVMRIAIEHILLDYFFGERRVPERCVIVARRFPDDDALLTARSYQDGERVGGWLYWRDGPSLDPYDGPERPTRPKGGAASWASWQPSIVIRYPATLQVAGYGRSIFDRYLFPLPMPGWEYYIRREDDEWLFYRYRGD